MCRILVGERDTFLDSGEHIVGRSPDATVFVNDAGVSCNHARITIDE